MPVVSVNRYEQSNHYSLSLNLEVLITCHPCVEWSKTADTHHVWNWTHDLTPCSFSVGHCYPNQAGQPASQQFSRAPSSLIIQSFCSSPKDTSDPVMSVLLPRRHPPPSYLFSLMSAGDSYLLHLHPHLTPVVYFPYAARVVFSKCLSNLSVPCLI